MIPNLCANHFDLFELAVIHCAALSEIIHKGTPTGPSLHKGHAGHIWYGIIRLIIAKMFEIPLNCECSCNDATTHAV